MFTGIIEAVKPVLSVQDKDGSRHVRIGKPRNWKLRKGQSVSIDGVCTTVVSQSPVAFNVEYMPETLSKTTMQFVERGTELNLERSVTLRSPLDGHLIQGHVDSSSEVVSIVKVHGKHEVTVNIPPALKPYIAPHGAITVNGVSLTVARKTERTFTVALIPYTLRHSNLQLLEEGSVVNLEVDLLARHVVNALGKSNH